MPLPDSLIHTLTQLLRTDVVPAMGCTEPACCALAAAHASSHITGPVESIRVEVSGNLLKNAMEVGIPGSGGLRGLPIAIALGVAIADPAKGLGIFTAASAEKLQQAHRLEPLIKVSLATTAQVIHACVEVVTSRGKARAVISGSHDNLVLLEVDGNVIHTAAAGEVADPGEPLRAELVKHSFREIIEALSRLDAETTDFLLQGLDMNLLIARSALDNPVGMGMGFYYKGLVDDLVISADLVTEAKMLTAAAVDARMHGVEMAVMSSCGSGNQGIAATVPLYAVATHFGIGREKLAQAIALSHLTNSYIKHYTGKLNAMCGCVTAGIGTALGTGMLLGLKRGDMTGIVNNMVGTLAGIICDGAKAGCALKLATGVDAALTAALLVQRGIVIPETNGICGATAEESIINMARVVTPGMVPADGEILSIMVDRGK